MIKIVLSVLSLFFISTAFAQADTVQAPYKKFPSFPPAKLLLPDSATYFTKADLDKKKPVMLMLFNPGCSHCQHETEELTKKMDDFKTDNESEWGDFKREFSRDMDVLRDSLESLFGKDAR